ncbi:uncharacterized protein LOC129226067 isoform X1 [Uloborus diversus]|uniref:uncharacterized protein LOC129226067 isoform X1 n=1 Tax=Uloborus diversus TaxID=327109 RepID=UPI00240A2566|nr:uncharacterized protein LOC129226067 isoform X1 [Uloborus diversus]
MRTSPLVLERQQRKMHTPSAVRVERLQGKMWSRAAPQRVAAQVMQQKKYGMTPVESALLAPLMNKYQAAQQAQGKMYSRPAVQQERLQNMMYSRPAVQQERLQAMMYPTPAVQQENSQGNMYAPAAFQQKRNEFLNHYSAHAAAQQGSHAHSFLYNINHGDGGSHYRSESGDGNGNVVGSYTLSGPDGRYRLVKYLADEGGFRAIVKTNEHGTREESPSHAQFVSLV